MIKKKELMKEVDLLTTKAMGDYKTIAELTKKVDELNERNETLACYINTLEEAILAKNSEIEVLADEIDRLDEENVRLKRVCNVLGDYEEMYEAERNIVNGVSELIEENYDGLSKAFDEVTKDIQINKAMDLINSLLR